MANIKETVGDLLPGNKGYLSSTELFTWETSKAISNIISFLTIIAGLAFIIYFIIGAINWIASGGDPNKVKTAQLMITQALIGITIAVIAYPVIIIISQLLGIGIHLDEPFFRLFYFILKFKNP